MSKKGEEALRLLFLPGTSFLSRLSFRAKFITLAIVCLVPLGFLATVLDQHLTDEIRASASAFGDQGTSRTHDLARLRLEVRLIAGGAALCLGYLLVGCWLGIRSSIKTLQTYSRRMLEGSEEPLTMQHHDEFGSLAHTFNAISAILGVHRLLADEVEIKTEKLRASEELFRTLARKAPIGIFMTDPDGACMFINEEWSRMARLSPEQARGNGWISALHPADKERIPREWFEAVLAGRNFISQARFGTLTRPETHVAFEAVALHDPAGQVTGYLGIAADITERSRVEQRKNEFISTVSHELRTPLTSILGSLGLISGGMTGALAPSGRTMIDIAKRNCERLVRLVSDILDIEKIESGTMQFQIRPQRLTPLIEQAIDSNRAYAQKYSVRIVAEPDLPDVTVLADGDRLNQVLTNLLSNAAKFSPRNEVIGVSVTQTGERVRISVSDHGAGIPEEFQARIFQRFAQADSSDTRTNPGTGLGLSICKAIVERMGGQIGFDTEAGRGTTFYLELPTPSSPVPAGASASPGSLLRS